MDRQVEEDLCTLEPVCEFYGWLGVEEVIVVDPHSGETIRFLEKYKVNARAVYPIKEWLPTIMQDFNFSKNAVVVLPDNGANNRYGDYLRGKMNVCAFDKKRDPITRKITEIRLVEGAVIPGATHIVVDDICAKGSTALETAEYLNSQGAGELILVVTFLETTALEGNVLSRRKSPYKKVFTSQACMREAHPMVHYMPVDVDYYV
jgi:phosphoribosylpyrophosphate synthetase